MDQLYNPTDTYSQAREALSKKGLRILDTAIMEAVACSGVRAWGFCDIDPQTPEGKARLLAATANVAELHCRIRSYRSENP